MSSVHGTWPLARHDFIAAGAASLRWLVAGNNSAVAAASLSDIPVSTDPPSSVNTLGFDVFGTVVDWRGSIIRKGELLSAPRPLEFGPQRKADAPEDGAGITDFTATNFMDLATQLGV